MGVNTWGPAPSFLDEITGGELEKDPKGFRYVPKEPVLFKGWGDEKGRECRWKRLFGGHYCRPPKKLFRNNAKPIYIIRDGRDVMVSLWNKRNAVREDQVSFEDYFWKFYPGRAKPYVFPEGTPIAGLWWWATLSWTMLADRILFVRYESLVRDKEEQLDRIADYLKKKKGPARPEEDQPVGLVPQAGNPIGRWKEHFTEEMLEYWFACRSIAIQLTKSGKMKWPSN
jgi:hypothetical protein